MRVLIVEDELQMASLIRRGLVEGGTRRGRRAHRRGRALDGAGARLRRDRARRDAARARRLRDVPPAARGRRLGAGPDADRARLGRGPGRRARQRRRRLPGQAVRVRRAARAAARARPPRRAPSGRRCSTVGDLRLDPATRAGRRGARRRSRSRRRSSRCSRRSCAGRARCCRGFTCSSTRGTSPTRTARTSSTSTSGACARRSTSRSARDSLETVRGVGYRLRERRSDVMSRLPIRIRVTRGFAVAMAARARGDRALPLPAARLASRARARPRAAAPRPGPRGARQRSRMRRSPRQPRPPRRARRELRAARRPDRARARCDPPLGRLADPDLRASSPRARAWTVYVDRGSVPGLDEPSRCSRPPLNAGGRRLVLVVGATRQDRVETLASFRDELLIARPDCARPRFARRATCSPAVAAAGRVDAQARRRASPPTRPASGCPFLRRATSSSGSARR